VANVLSDLLRDGRADASSAHAVALANALCNESIKAVAELERMSATNSDPAVWNDLAAARYNLARAAQRPEMLGSALAAADTALRGRGDLVEARFNRALIIERLGLRGPAVAAWTAYLELEGTSGWAMEARDHLRTLSPTALEFPLISDQETARLVADPLALRELVHTFPQEARLAAERELLGRWGAAVTSANHDAAARDLAVASIIGDELAQLTGDRMLERSVAAIGRADAATRPALVNGHASFTEALKLFRAGRAGDAEPIFERAARELERGSSPFALTARFFAGYVRYEQGQVSASTRELEALLSRVPKDLLTLRATIQWQLAICFGAEARWGDDIATAEASLENFVRAKESFNAAMMREHIAQAYDLIGDSTTAWKYRAVSLPELGRTSTRFLQAGVLGFLTQEAVFRRDWAQAASFSELELEVGKVARYAPGLADGRLRRAFIRRQLGASNAEDDLSRARTIMGAIPDAGMRSRLESRAVAVEAMLAPTPGEAVPLLTAAIDFHNSPRGQRMFLPSLLLYRARAQRVLDQGSAARRDLDAAIAELDSGRDTLTSSEQRTGMFESASGILDEAIDLALEQNDVVGAFAYAEHARARTLLDTMRSAAPMVVPPRIPARTNIVEYAVLPSRVVVFVARATEIRVATRIVERSVVAARAAAFTQSVAKGDAADAAGAALYQDLFAPIETWIGEDETLVIVPDATTSSIPFAALPLRDGRFLVQRNTLVFAPSAAVFARCYTERERLDMARSRLLLVSADNDSASGLPGASDEVRRIARLYGDVQSLVGSAATRTEFLRKTASASVIHFAGHGLSSEVRPEDTALLLSGVDGRMTISDIARLQLASSPTVVLAACSTARGQVRRYEGTLSVARAFLAAGASSVVATLWPIDDREASVFFPLIHERLVRGVPPADALRAAQLDAIREARSPSLWAAVQVIGS
jgi:CHAT domain-containing protein